MTRNEFIHQTERDGSKVIVRANLVLDTIIACATCAAVLDAAELIPEDDNLSRNPLPILRRFAVAMARLLELLRALFRRDDALYIADTNERRYMTIQHERSR